MADAGESVVAAYTRGNPRSAVRKSAVSRRRGPESPWSRSPRRGPETGGRRLSDGVAQRQSGSPRRQRPSSGGSCMRSLPLDIGLIHFVGIGGIGMSGIAEVMHNLNYRVQGSDIAENASVQWLRDKGISVVLGHDASNVDDAAVVVVSSAVKPDNPEIVAARERLVPVVRRAEMLARAHEAEVVDRSRRHPRQDDHDIPRRGASRCSRLRPNRDQRRGHKRLRCKRSPRRGGVDWSSRRMSPTARSSNFPRRLRS